MLTQDDLKAISKLVKDEVTGGIKPLSEKVSGLSEQVSNLEKQTGGLEHQVNGLKEQLDDFKEHTEERFDRLEQKMDEGFEGVLTISDKIAKALEEELDKHDKRITKLEQKAII